MPGSDGCAFRLRGISFRGIAVLPAILVLALVAGERGWREVWVNGPGVDGGPPRLLIPKSPLDLGLGLPGEELTGSVPLMNMGGRELRIEKMEAGCGCALMNLWDATIAPGAKVNLQVAVPIKTEGQHLQFPIRIYSNDPVSPETVYTVRAEAAPAFLRTDLAQIDFGQVPVGTAPTKGLKLLKPDETPWPTSEPVTFESVHGLIQIDNGRRQGDARGEGQVLNIRPRTDLSAGNFTDALTIRPPGSRRAVQIPVRGIIVPPFIISPSGLYFGAVDPRSDVLKRFVLLRRTNGKNLNRVVRSTAPPGIRLTQMEPGDRASASDRARLLVTLDPTVVTHDVKDGKLLLWLEDEPDPLIIKIMIFIRRDDAPSDH